MMMIVCVSFNDEYWEKNVTINKKNVTISTTTKKKKPSSLNLGVIFDLQNYRDAIINAVSDWPIGNAEPTMLSFTKCYIKFIHCFQRKWGI